MFGGAHEFLGTVTIEETIGDEEDDHEAEEGDGDADEFGAGGFDEIAGIDFFVGVGADALGFGEVSSGLEAGGDFLHFAAEVFGLSGVPAAEAEAHADIEDGEFVIGGGGFVFEGFFEEVEEFFIAGHFMAFEGEFLPFARPGEGGLLDHEIAEEHEYEFGLFPLLGKVGGDGFAAGFGEEALDFGLHLVEFVVTALASGTVEAAYVLKKRLGQLNERGGLRFYGSADGHSHE